MIQRQRNNIVLISLYSSDAIGLRYISAFLKKHNVNVNLIFFKEKYLEADLMSLPTEKEYFLLINLIKELKPHIVGVSLRSSFFRIASALTDKMRKEFNVPVIWGGTHPSVAPEECIQIADMVCVGEGEHPLLELEQAFSKGHRIDDIKNIWIRKGKEVIRNPVRPLLRDLDRLPFPDYDSQGKYFIEENEISSDDPVSKRFNLDIMASRGCPYRCTFCCNSIFLETNRGKGPPIRRRSVNNVIEEIQSLMKRFRDLKRIDFIDEVFAWDEAWATEFSAKYHEHVNLPFQCAQHPNMVNKDILIMLRKAGLERVEVGIQSGSERVRKDVFGRSVSDEALIKTGRIISELKLVPSYDLIVDNPFETDKDRKMALDFILKLPRPFHLRMYPLTYFPNTALTKNALAAGVITKDQVENKAERTHSKWFVTLDYDWSNRERFWISLYSLTSKSFIPKKLIRWLGHRKILLKYPKPLSALATLSNNIKLGTIAIKWLLEGKPLRAIFRHTTRAQSHWQI